MKRCFILTVMLLATSCILSLTSCESAKSAVHTVSSDGYVQFTGDTMKYADKVDVTLDDSSTFAASVNSTGTIQIRRDSTYQMSSGPHTITVSYKGKEILFRKIFVSQQEICTVELP